MTSENYTQEILDELNKFKKLHAQTATLRDQLAMAALPYVLSEEAISYEDCFKRFNLDKTEQVQPHHWMTLKCEKAYEIADTMLEAREKTNDR